METPTNQIESLGLNATALEQLSLEESKAIAKSLRGVLAMNFHPDKGGDERAYKEIESAYKAVAESDEVFQIYRDELLSGSTFSREIGKAHELSSFFARELGHASRQFVRYVRGLNATNRDWGHGPGVLLGPIEITLEDVVGHGDDIAAGQNSKEEPTRVDRRMQQMFDNPQFSDDDWALKIRQAQDAEFAFDLLVDEEGRVTFRKDGIETAQPNKVIVGGMHHIRFTNHFSLADFHHQIFEARAGKDKDDKRIPSRGDTMATKAQAHFDGRIRNDELPFEPGILMMEQFGWLAAELTSQIELKSYVFSFNTPPSEPPYFRLEGRVMAPEWQKGTLAQPSSPSQASASMDSATGSESERAEP